MAGFDVVRRTTLDAGEAWRRVTDWERHGDFAPLTRVRAGVDPRTGCQRFVARTSVGPVGFDDPMVVTYFQPPSKDTAGVARIVKDGRVVLGWAVLTVTPLQDGSEVRWHEEARLRGSIGPVTALVDLVVKGGFRRLLDGLLAEPRAG